MERPFISHFSDYSAETETAKRELHSPFLERATTGTNVQKFSIIPIIIFLHFHLSLFLLSTLWHPMAA